MTTKTGNRAAVPGRWALVGAACFLSLFGGAPTAALAQTDYYNTDRNRPIRIEDAYPTERYSFDAHLAPVRLERAVGGVYTWGLEPEVAYGVLPRTQLEIGAPVAVIDLGDSHQAGLAGIDVSALYNFNAETSSLPAFGVRGSILAPVGSLAPEHTYSSISGLATRTYRWARFHLNGEYTWGKEPVADEPVTAGAAATPALGTGASEISRWLAGVAVDKTFPLRAMLVTAEAYARQPIVADEDVEWNAGVGVRYQLDPHFALDGGIGRRLTGNDQAWYLTFGVARVFGIRSLMPGR